MKKRIYIKIYGDVIGVGFRGSTRQLAQELGLLGYARNCADQAVEIEAEGEEDKVKELLEWLRVGPSHARVEKIDFGLKQNKNEFKEFIIKY